MAPEGGRQELSELVRLAVPARADWCALDLLVGRQLHRLALAQVPSIRIPEERVPCAVWRVLRHGRPERLRRDSPDPEQRSQLMRLGLDAYLGVPLLHAGEVAGVISFGQPALGLEEALAFAERAGAALQRAVERQELDFEVRPASRSLQLLVVDDHLDALEMLSAALRYAGHRVSPASDGRCALQLAETERPEVAVLDLAMPGMDGYELAQRLRAAHPSLVLVALTGYGHEAARRRSRAAGFREHLVKPVGLDRLLEIIEALAS